MVIGPLPNAPLSRPPSPPPNTRTCTIPSFTRPDSPASTRGSAAGPGGRESAVGHAGLRRPAAAAARAALRRTKQAAGPDAARSATGDRWGPLQAGRSAKRGSRLLKASSSHATNPQLSHPAPTPTRGGPSDGTGRGSRPLGRGSRQLARPTPRRSGDAPVRWQRSKPARPLSLSSGLTASQPPEATDGPDQAKPRRRQGQSSRGNTGRSQFT